MKPSVLLPILLLLLFLPEPADAADRREIALARALEPYLACLAGENREFTLRAFVEARVDGRTERAALVYERQGDGVFRFSLAHRAYPVRLIRLPDRTVLVLPAKKTAIVAEGADGGWLEPKGSFSRLVSRRTEVSTILGHAATVGLLEDLSEGLGVQTLVELADLTPGPGRGEWVRSSGEVLTARNGALTVSTDDIEIRLSLGPAGSAILRADVPEDYRVVRVDRDEMERVVGRGLRRGLELLAPARAVPAPVSRTVSHGTLRFEGGQRVVLLAGSPAEIGTAHGELLGEEARLCIDSTYHLVGLAYTVERGRWFPDELRAAHRRLLPHIPEDHLTEIDALADAIGEDRETVRLANVFPELFHCSGFAVFGRATAGGKLYHGRVLDYMTMIGLQDCAALFVVKVDGKHPFANVGYAGFTGCVSGMNDCRISLGEMGGRGEGDWDGAPMATLMRRALEECETLDEVIALWSKAPRTCEYYYVWADGKIPDAVGVKATPEVLEILRAGQAHDVLGEGISDAVVLSGGGRLRELRKRVLDGHGRIDERSALELMSRPVAMRSNLHNVLFVPQDLALHVAHAAGRKPACEMPYVRFDLADLLAEAERLAGDAGAPSRTGAAGSD